MFFKKHVSKHQKHLWFSVKLPSRHNKSNGKVMFSLYAYFHFLLFLFPKHCEELNTDEDELTLLMFHVMPVSSFCFLEE